jgi:tripartite-type tricarboxylate transporter receptor subunit TctC
MTPGSVAGIILSGLAGGIAMPNIRSSSTVVCALATAALFVAASTSARAQADYPNRAIKIIVPAPPGPMLDVLPRIIGDKLSARWRQPVLIENRPGFAQNLGAEAVWKAEPDGYTLVFTPPGPLVVSQHIYTKLNFDPNTFTPVSVMVTVPPTFIASAKLPVSSFKEFVAYAKANPNKITYGSPGPGSTPQLAMENLQTAAGIHLVHVPYQGLAPALRDLLAGHIDVMIDNLGNILPHLKDNQLKLLAVTTAARLPEVPDTPAVSELLPGYLHQDWFAFAAPPKTPPEIAAKISREIADIMKLPDVAKRIEDFVVRPVGGTPQEMGALMKSETERWRQVIAASGIKPN